MKSLVYVICLIGSAACQQWGIVQVRDTPEVAAAKSAHLAALSAAQDRSWDGPEDDGSYRPEQYGESWNGEGSWRAEEMSQDNTWAEGDDGSYRQEHHDGPWSDSYDQQHQWTHPIHHEKKWTGPLALPPGYDKNGAPLPVLDTPEVAAEKSKHLHLYSHGAFAAAAAIHP